MSAAFVGAAEAALLERGVPGPVRIVAETDQTVLVAVSVSNELLLILVANKGSATTDLRGKADAAAQALRKLAEGATT